MVLVADFKYNINVELIGNNRLSSMRVVQFFLKSGSGTVIFSENVHFVRLQTGSRIMDISRCNPCVTPICGTL